LTRPAGPASASNQVRADARTTTQFTTRWREDPYNHDGGWCYERLILVTRGGVIERVFYPVDRPQRSAARVIAWLRATGR